MGNERAARVIVAAFAITGSACLAGIAGWAVYEMVGPITAATIVVLTFAGFVTWFRDV